MAATNSTYSSSDLTLGTYIFTAFLIVYILLIPLFIFILYLGYQQWRKGLSRTRSTAMSHSDVFTLNMVVLELISVFGSVLYGCGLYTNKYVLQYASLLGYGLVLVGQNLFHILTCLDRYLAVCHPIVYLRLRQGGGVRIRNIIIGCVWLICCGCLGSVSDPFVHIFIHHSLLVAVAVVVVFCTISILRVLIRPGPGEVGGNTERVDQIKRRSMITILAILGALVFKALSPILSMVLYFTVMLTPSEELVILWSLAWLVMPSSLILPLLFLHRAGKLPRCGRSTRAEQDQSDQSPEHLSGRSLGKKKIQKKVST